MAMGAGHRSCMADAAGYYRWMVGLDDMFPSSASA